MKTFLKFFLSAILVISSVLVSIWGLNKKGFFGLEQIIFQIEDDQKDSKYFNHEMEKVRLELLEMQGQSLWEIDLQKISDQLHARPWIADLQIRRSWPNELVIRLKTKEIKFLFLSKKGLMQPVLNDGTILSAVSSQNIPDAILLRGESFTQKKELLKSALAMIDKVPRQGSFSQSAISEITYDAKSGFVAQLMNSTIMVKLGEDQADIQSERVSQVLDYLREHELDARVIDANLTKKVLVRLRKGP